MATDICLIRETGSFVSIDARARATVLMIARPDDHRANREPFKANSGDRASRTEAGGSSWSVVALARRSQSTTERAGNVW